MGGEVVLPCRPPRGRPDPSVRWKKDSELVKTGDRVVLEESGALRLRDARKEDSGIYVCVAYNIGGEKDSIPARLTVRGQKGHSFDHFFSHLFTCSGVESSGGGRGAPRAQNF